LHELVGRVAVFVRRAAVGDQRLESVAQRERAGGGARELGADMNLARACEPGQREYGEEGVKKPTQNDREDYLSFL
jgi:hypothetical protein